eukprot:366235-Chlamydomonas_euryale.AAC.1
MLKKGFVQTALVAGPSGGSCRNACAFGCSSLWTGYELMLKKGFVQTLLVAGPAAAAAGTIEQQGWHSTVASLLAAKTLRPGGPPQQTRAMAATNGPAAACFHITAELHDDLTPLGLAVRAREAVVWRSGVETSVDGWQLCLCVEWVWGLDGAARRSWRKESLGVRP